MTCAPEYFLQTRRERLASQGRWEPPRRVLAVQASHRGAKGLTGALCKALSRGMAEAGARIETVALADLDFSPCRGCFKCWGKNPGQCPIKDDLTPLIRSIPSYDLMLWAMPLYVDGMPALLKTMVERMMVLNHPAILESGDGCLHPCLHADMPFLAVAAACGFWGGENFSPLWEHLRALARNQHTPLAAAFERPAGLGLMLPSGREAFARVEQALVRAGRELLQNGSVSPGLLREISSPLLDRSLYMDLGRNWWKGRL